MYFCRRSFCGGSPVDIVLGMGYNNVVEPGFGNGGMRMAEQTLLELKGSVEDIVFRNSQNGYSVLVMNSNGIAVTAVGCMTDVSVGDDLSLKGVLESSSRLWRTVCFFLL